MVKPKPHKKLYMCRSCLTGKVVWLHYAVSAGAKRVCYCNAKKHDAKLSRKWKKMEERRRHVILGMLSECLGDIPLTQPLTAEQIAAAKRLQALASESVPFYRGFLEHAREERRRRNKHLKMMRERREREAAQAAQAPK